MLTISENAQQHFQRLIQQQDIPGLGIRMAGSNLDNELRRLQVAAEAGASLAFAFRPLRVRDNPSPAPLRLSLSGREDSSRPELRVLKCRGALPPAAPLPFHPHIKH